MGDPETQAVLNLLDTDLLELIEAAVSGSLSEVIMKWKKGSACCVVLASGGYPGSYKKGYAIKGIEETDCSVLYCRCGKQREPVNNCRRTCP